MNSFIKDHLDRLMSTGSLGMRWSRELKSMMVPLSVSGFIYFPIVNPFPGAYSATRKVTDMTRVRCFHFMLARSLS